MRIIELKNIKREIILNRIIELIIFKNYIYRNKNISRMRIKK